MIASVMQASWGSLGGVTLWLLVHVGPALGLAFCTYRHGLIHGFNDGYSSHAEWTRRALRKMFERNQFAEVDALLEAMTETIEGPEQ